ncbi:N-methyl-L-tryptophan oxidase [Thorsellia kenyensis]|uniref:N-methyl-L-tryptophan oxidase n=1 Tax=Thorsellia kenyensis TaxID=1549888 RepID=A0ABV6CBM7_9GAMM
MASELNELGDMKKEYDLIIIGTGSVGSAAGYYSAKAGLKVLMVDEFMPPHQHGSHHGETRIMRQAYGEGDEYVPMLLQAQKLWLGLKDYVKHTSGIPIFEQCGVLNAGPSNALFITQAIKSANKYALEVEVKDAKTCKKIWPELQLPENYSAVYEPNAGVLFCENIIESYLELSKQVEAEHAFNCKVFAVETSESGVQVKTSQGDFFASKAIVTAGTWVREIFPNLPITPIRRVFAWHQADGRFSYLNNFPAFTIEDEHGEAYYGFPAVDNALKIGKHIEWEIMHSREDRVPFGSKISDGSALLKFLKRFLPGVGGCLMGKSCSYDMTSDGHFIIDTLDEQKKIMLISGLSGHGFKFASVLGEIGSSFARNEPIPYDLSFFSLKRFTEQQKG